MGAGLVVVLVVTGLFVLLPLWFAWLSMDSRRWQRVERILGREPSGKEPRWVWWAWIGLSAAYVVIGALRVASGRERFIGVVWLFQGVAFGVLAGSFYLRWRRERERGQSRRNRRSGRWRSSRPPPWRDAVGHRLDPKGPAGAGRWRPRGQERPS